MSSLESLQPYFFSNIRTRGRKYFEGGRVHLKGRRGGSIAASVRGAETYDVGLVLNESQLTVSCTCPHFVRGYFCKHIWASLLKAEEESFLPAKSRQLDLVSEYEEDGEMWNPDQGPDDMDSPFGSNSGARGGTSNAEPDAWKDYLEKINSASDAKPTPQPILDLKIEYRLNLEDTYHSGLPSIRPLCRTRKNDGSLGKRKALRINRNEIDELVDPLDRRILAILARIDRSYAYGYDYGSINAEFQLPFSIQDTLLPMLCDTGRFGIEPADVEMDVPALQMDHGDPWKFMVEVQRMDEQDPYIVTGALHRGEERRDLSSPRLLLWNGWVIWSDAIARLEHIDSFSWISLLRMENRFEIPADAGKEFVESALQGREVPRLVLPEELMYREVCAPPVPELLVKPDQQNAAAALRASVRFLYEGRAIPMHETGPGVFCKEEYKFLLRDEASESEAIELLQQIGVRPARRSHYMPDHPFEIASSKFSDAVWSLLSKGWQVKAEGKKFRSPGEISMGVSSGIDWFELRGGCDFEGESLDLPVLLRALQKGDRTVRLGDGSVGVLPDEWLQKFAAMAGMGTIEEDHIRFKTTQAGFLDALLASQPEATCDATFLKMREELESFSSIKSMKAHSRFKGTLREYQEEGLGWLFFLQKFGFGGCLADDMGLGKTVQVLALLTAHHAKQNNGSSGRPSLVVVPSSLLFNWRREAERFTPHLKVLEHSGIQRIRKSENLRKFGVVVTSYGTLRRDIAFIKDIEWEYAVLDEAQAIKNEKTQASKATRLLNAKYRLALSGTPIENHLGELWSLFDFLNPGMLGTAGIFRMFAGDPRTSDEHAREMLRKALRPFILRRTKSQVAKDLPERMEETLYCDMPATQRKHYDELRKHFQQSLLNRVEQEGMNRSKIHVLEALLRLRQAACHQGLIDANRLSEESAKLDLLIPRLTEVVEEGNKALVFSQFTSFLSIVRERLDKSGIVYEYLDGRTRNRQQRVDRFQEDEDCKLFLISLKAGGLGLNLTAAEYVFLLDPWWNPAVEAQAIDRAHRIGQTRRVFAYRLIARDTVEEKVIELQKTKRDLADAIITADNSLIRSLTKEDLNLLLT